MTVHTASAPYSPSPVITGIAWESEVVRLGGGRLAFSGEYRPGGQDYCLLARKATLTVKQ